MKTKEEEKKARLMKGIDDMLRFANEKIEGHDMADSVQVDAWSLQCMVWILTDMKKAIEDREHEEMLGDALNAMRECRFHDWLCYHAEELSRAELVEVLIEYAYQLERFNPVCTIDGGTASQEIADSLRITHR